MKLKTKQNKTVLHSRSNRFKCLFDSKTTFIETQNEISMFHGWVKMTQNWLPHKSSHYCFVYNIYHILYEKMQIIGKMCWRLSWGNQLWLKRKWKDERGCYSLEELFNELCISLELQKMLYGILILLINFKHPIFLTSHLKWVTVCNLLKLSVPASHG